MVFVGLYWLGGFHQQARFIKPILGCSQETTEGEEVLSNLPEKMRELDSVFLIDESGKWYAQSTAVIRILLGLGFPYNFGAIIWFIPSPIRNFAYDLYARNRKRYPSNS